MRLASFRDGAGMRAAVIDGDRVLDAGHEMEELIAEWAGIRPELQRLATDPTGPAVARLSEVHIGPPVSRPSKIIGIGMNYLDHCREQGQEPPKTPVVFAKFPNAIVGPEDAIHWPAGLTKQVDWEVELCIVVGPRAGASSRSDVFGYTIANDVSARDLQFGDGQFVRGKSLDTFCPIGPAILTADEVVAPHALRLGLTLNGASVQDSSTSQLIFGVNDLMEFLNLNFTLEPGDLVLTGTPSGVGAFRNPPVFLKKGDVMSAWIEGFGELRNPVLGPVRAGEGAIA